MRAGVLAAAMAALACASAPGTGDVAPPAASAAEAAPDPWRDLERLRAAGPTDTEYDDSPRLRPGEWLSELLTARLLPVVRERRLPPDAHALVWVLVDPEGSVADARLHATSGTRAFDAAAVETAKELRYAPARRAGAPVPVWVLADVSLLLR